MTTLRYEHLIGLPFEHGVQDCYTMLQRMMKDNADIELSPFSRPDDWWLDPNFNFYIDNYRSEGFNLVEDGTLNPQIMDTFLIAIPDPRDLKRVVTNHCAIYVGDGQVIHHRLGRFSEVVQYKGALRNLTTHVIRHSKIPKFETPVAQKLDIMDRLLPHKRELLLGAMNDRNGKEGR